MILHNYMSIYCLYRTNTLLEERNILMNEYANRCTYIVCMSACGQPPWWLKAYSFRPRTVGYQERHASTGEARRVTGRTARTTKHHQQRYRVSVTPDYRGRWERQRTITQPVQASCAFTDTVRVRMIKENKRKRRCESRPAYTESGRSWSTSRRPSTRTGCTQCWRQQRQNQHQLHKRWRLL